MLRRIAIALAAASLFGSASIPTGALASGHGGHFAGGGLGHGGFAGGGFARGFEGGVARSFAGPAVAGAPRSFVGHAFVGRGLAPRFRDHRFARFGAPFVFGLGLGYGAYSYYGDPCYAWTPSGYTWVCGYDD